MADNERALYNSEYQINLTFDKYGRTIGQKKGGNFGKIFVHIARKRVNKMSYIYIGETYNFVTTVPLRREERVSLFSLGRK